MINYVKKTIDGIETQVPVRFDDSFVIDLDDFKYINKLYKFSISKPAKCWYDKKHRKVVAYLDKNLYTKDYDIYFNKNWLANECIITKSKKLRDMLKKYPENAYIYKEVCKILQKQKEEFDKYISKGYYNKKASDILEEGEKDDTDF